MVLNENFNLREFYDYFLLTFFDSLRMQWFDVKNEQAFDQFAGHQL